MKVMPQIKSRFKSNANARFFAYITDLFCIGIIQKLLVIQYMGYMGQFYSKIPTLMKLQLSKGSEHINWEVFTLVFLTYFFFSFLLSNGKTIGNLIFGLRLVDKNSIDTRLELTPWRIAARAFTYLFNNTVFYLPFLINLVTKSNRGIEDWFSGTVTLKDEEINQIVESSTHLIETPIILPPLPIDNFDEAA
jgi:uncharacterized RDD family membrane protein YckC